MSISPGMNTDFKFIGLDRIVDRATHHFRERAWIDFELALEQRLGDRLADFKEIGLDVAQDFALEIAKLLEKLRQLAKNGLCLGSRLNCGFFLADFKAFLIALGFGFFHDLL